MVCYNISALLFSILIVVLYEQTDSLGLSELGTCFISIGSIGEKIDAAFNFFFLIAIWISYFMIRKQLGCCYGPAFHHLSKVILAVSITAFISRFVTSVLYFQNRDKENTSVTTKVVGCIATILWGMSVAITRMFHPKVFARVKEKCGYLEIQTESLIEVDKEKEEILKSILHLTIDGASDDIADMFEHLGHKILVQILVLLTLRYREDKGHDLSLQEVLKEYAKTKEHKHYSMVYYSELSKELTMPFIEQIYCPDVSIIEYQKNIFHCIMRSSGFDTYILLESLLSYENIKALAQISNRGGKSNSFFYCSSNQKIVIKTITYEEKMSFLKFLPAYSRRVIENPGSKLVRIFGLFQVLPHKQDFIVMENAVPYMHNCLVFDLKGSTVDRHVPGVDSEDPPCGVLLKDLNFKRFGEKILIENSDDIKKDLIADMKLLKNNNLMDYSMLLAIYNDSDIRTKYSISPKHSIAIIDFFQRYGIKKNVERVWKRYILRKTKGISVISPKRYYIRIKHYLHKIMSDGKIN